MHANSSLPDWFTTTLHWPVERIPLRVEIVEPRKLTALEWALLRVMDAFPDEPPSLIEVAQELGFNDPRFLHDTLREVKRLNALTARPGTPGVRFEDTQFTELGERFYRKGQIEAEPATHGATLHIDALTDEDLPSLPGLKEEVTGGLLAGQIEVARRSVSLDRVRKALRVHHPTVLKGDAEARSISLADDDEEVGEPDIAWRPVKLRIGLGADGALTVDAEGLTKKAREFLDQQDLVAHSVLPVQAVSGQWPPTSPMRRSSRVPFTTWRALVADVTPNARVGAAVMQLINDARTEIVLHATWCGLEGCESGLRKARERGVRVLVVGASTTSVVSPAVGPKPAPIVHVLLDEVLPGCIVADGARGLLLDDVRADWRGQAVTVEIAGGIADVRARGRRLELVQAALAALPTPVIGVAAVLDLIRTPLDQTDVRVGEILAHSTMQFALCRLAFGQAEGDLAAVLGAARTLALGVERIPLARSLASMCRTLCPAVAAGAERAWVEAWESVFTANGRVTEPLLDRQATWAPPGSSVERFVNFAVRSWVSQGDDAAGVQRAESAVGRLVRVGAMADRHWPAGSARSCASWRELRDEVLAVPVSTPEELTVLVKLARQVLNAAELRFWAEGQFADVLGNSSDLAPWLWRAKALGSLVTPARLVALILGDDGPVEDVARLHAALREQGIASLSPVEWQALVATRLPRLESFNSSEHAGLVEELVRTAAFEPGRAALSAWAQALARAVPTPTGPEGLAWWLGEIGALAPAMPEAAPGLCRRPLHEHASALLDARKRGLPIWDEVRDAWSHIAPVTVLDELIAKDTRQGQPAQKNQPKKGKKP